MHTGPSEYLRIWTKEASSLQFLCILFDSGIWFFPLYSFVAWFLGHNACIVLTLPLSTPWKTPSWSFTLGSIACTSSHFLSVIFCSRSLNSVMMGENFAMFVKAESFFPPQLHLKGALAMICPLLLSICFREMDCDLLLLSLLCFSDLALYFWIICQKSLSNYDTASENNTECLIYLPMEKLWKILHIRHL